MSDELPLAHIAIAFEGASWTDPDSIALMIMQTMLGAWSKYHMADNHGYDQGEAGHYPLFGHMLQRKYMYLLN